MIYNYHAPRSNHWSDQISNNLNLKKFLDDFSDGIFNFVETRAYKESGFSKHRVNFVYPEQRKKVIRFIENNKSKPGFTEYMYSLNSNHLPERGPSFTFEGIMLMGNLQEDTSL